MKKKKKDIAAILIGKRATYTSNFTNQNTSFSVGYVENAGKGDWVVYPTRYSNGIFIPREVLGELVQFGEVVRKTNLGDGEIYIETWELE